RLDLGAIDDALRIEERVVEFLHLLGLAVAPHRLGEADDGAERRADHRQGGHANEKEGVAQRYPAELVAVEVLRGLLVAPGEELVAEEVLGRLVQPALAAVEIDVLLEDGADLRALEGPLGIAQGLAADVVVRGDELADEIAQERLDLLGMRGQARDVLTEQDV